MKRPYMKEFASGHIPDQDFGTIQVVVREGTDLLTIRIRGMLGAMEVMTTLMSFSMAEALYRALQLWHDDETEPKNAMKELVTGRERQAEEPET